MRILQVIPFFSPRMGGSAQIAFQVSKRLAQLGHDVTIVTTEYPPNSPKYQTSGVQLIEFPNFIVVSGFYISPGLISWARKNIEQFDIIHLHTIRTYQNAVVRHYAIRRQIPYIISAHGTLPVISRHQVAKNIYDKFIGNRLIASAAAFVAVSRMEASQFRRAGIANKNIRIIYNGLDNSEFSDIPPKGAFRKILPKTLNKGNLILFLGRLDKIKRIGDLVEAFAKIVIDIPESVLVIAGPDDGELSTLKRISNRTHVQDRVIFVGPLYGNDKLSAYVDADVLVSPAIHEIFGLVAFEAISCGTPVVVAEGSASGQFIKEAQAGYTFDSESVNGLAETIKHVLLCPNEAQKKVEAGKQFVRDNLDWRKITSQYVDIYQECM